MARYWKHLVCYSLLLWILVACAGIESQAIPAASPEPSPTASLIPTNTPKLIHTVQPTATSEPTVTPSPISTATRFPAEVPTTPTEEPTATIAPTKILEDWQQWPTEEEIEVYLRNQVKPTVWPLQIDTWGLPWHVLTGALANPRLSNIDVGGGFEVKMAADFYYIDAQNEMSHVTVPIFMYRESTDQRLHFFSQQTGNGDKTDEEIVDYMTRRAGLGKAGAISQPIILYVDRLSSTGEFSSNSDQVLAESEVAAGLYDIHGISEIDFENFKLDGDAANLPLIDNERWLFPNQVADMYQQ